MSVSTGWYAVLGDPVSHSRSPQIHAAFAEQFGMDLRYAKIRVPAGQFEIRLKDMIAHRLQGANVTIPYKFDAFRLATERTLRAMLAQAANTLVIREDAIVADNTDGAGLVTDIENNLGFSLTGRRILLIGAGGAVAGVLGSLINRKPVSIVLANRTLEKAVALVKHFSHVDPEVILEPKALSAVGLSFYDCVINGTSASLSQEDVMIPPSVFCDCPLVYDMMYGVGLPFLEQAKVAGAMMLRDGLGMLVEQAAASFFLWHGQKPNTAPVIESIRATLMAQ